ncbi:1-deoxy-D-xylulose-5-phosphate synthase [bacterium]|nr:1-deoxy-D-xylulose-5-phosphate synthase [bacterium]
MQETTWLKKITSPKDLKGLRLETLESIASEIRRIIAQTCSRNGGHFAPSLGVVELTIALHYALNTPEDRLVWDVGHQTYSHKLLTGRAQSFHTLRLADGISGFPRRNESPYDNFGVGHASTAISAALGMALARDRRGEKNRVVAICGDGAMTGGLCYEALNNVGYLRPDMLIILNDNKMSISPNIGAISRHFNFLITNQIYNRSKETAEDLMNRVPAVGKRVVDFSQRLERSIKNLIVPEETIFEKMGIRYLGPVDGHDMAGLIEILEHVRDLKGPILLHVKTTKGKGYEYSELDPESWHSNYGFKISTGEKVDVNPGSESSAPLVPTYTEVFSETLTELAEKDDRIVAITAAMAKGTGLDTFARRFPDRLYDVGIAESHAVCSAAGMACEGLRPVVAIYSSFMQRAFDQIIHDVALQKLPVTFALDRAGLVGDDGPTHHGVFDIAYLRMIPDLVVMAPRDEEQLRRMVATAAAYEDGPIAYRYPRGKAVGVPVEAGPPATIEIGTGDILSEPQEMGKKVAILSLGPIATNALAAAKILGQAGIGTGVVDMRFVKPLDRPLLSRLAQEYDLLVTLEDSCLPGGFGSAVNEALGEIDFHKRALTLGLPDRWIEQGSVEELFLRNGLDPRGIARQIEEALEKHFGAWSSAHTVAK